MKVRTIAGSLALVIALAGAGTAVATASTRTQTQAAAGAQAPQLHKYNLLFPGLNHFFAKPQTPPLEPLLRFYMIEHTNSNPRSFKGTLCLHRWHFDFLHARWVQRRVFSCAHVGMGDLASPGDSVTWHLGDQPYPYWYCKPGRYFVSFGIHAVSSSGNPQHLLIYSPFHKGSRVSAPVLEDWGRTPPTRKESHNQTSCKKVKGA